MCIAHRPARMKRFASLGRVMLMGYGIPPIHYERPVWVHDLSIPSTPETESHAWWIGRWDEVRPHTYTTSIFTSDRNVHVGLDLGAPAGTVVRAKFRWQDPFARIERRTGRLRTDHHHGAPCRRPSILVAPWALDQDVARDVVRRGSSGPIRTTGCSRRRGGQWGYPPHLHLQVSLIEPETHDLPGVVTEKDRVEARRHFPDPRRYIGQVYDDGDQGGFRHRFR